MKLSDIIEVDQKINSLERDHVRMCQAYSLEHSPYKVGDIIPCKGASFTGKRVKVRAMKEGVNL